ncbi:hypothetical protein L249_2298 [Ophiocordyceps polyrhachis-furcata BCC 54312]|uniref:Perilipin MPL1-like protein n=1 Tax=Ophiocordyceps polyrhachis-furcata BCC 54312 TaxID=1330021 RepID=A0A367LQB7_9HYPO|nr:hypothetical protein L249_2298 [Ophiocordyceps polyrhachis-furcata BCC 54312]
MAVSQVNGDVNGVSRNSAFLQHLLNYPLISDGITTFKSNQLAQCSIRLGDSAYQTFALPVIPYFEKPYSYLSPYVSKADAIGDETLSRIDERFPAVKKPTREIYQRTRHIILLPLNMGIEGRDHVKHVFDSEVKKADPHQQGYVLAHGLAAVNTALVVSNETLSWLSSFLSAKKAEAAKAANDKVQQ